MASSWEVPHISKEGFKLLHTAGLNGEPNILQRLPSVNWIHRTPASLPSDISGIGDEIEGAMQQAPQPSLHSMAISSFLFIRTCQNSFLLYCCLSQKIKIIPWSIEMRLEEEIYIRQIFYRHFILDCQ